MGEQTCATCACWRNIDAESGKCCRHAPRFSPVETFEGLADELYGYWPVTMPDDFCGEWLPLPVAQAVEPSPEQQELARLRALVELADEVLDAWRAGHEGDLGSKLIKLQGEMVVYDRVKEKP